MLWICRRFGCADAVRHVGKRIDGMVALERLVVDSLEATQAGNQVYRGINDTTCRSLIFHH